MPGGSPGLLGEDSVVKKRIFRFLARFFCPKLPIGPLLQSEPLGKKYEANALIYNSDMRVIIIDPRTFFGGFFAQNLDFRIGPLTQNSLFLNKTLS